MTTGIRTARTLRSRAGRSRDAGATVVEFALVAAIFMFLMIGIADLGRWLFMSNAVSEAVRLGARLAVVCDRSAWNSGVLSKMQKFVPQLNSTNVSFQSFPSDACVAYGSGSDTVCTGVSVTVSGLALEPVSPWISEMPLLPFKVTLPRESMATSMDEVVSGGPSTNSVCN